MPCIERPEGGEIIELGGDDYYKRFGRPTEILEVLNYPTIHN